MRQKLTFSAGWTRLFGGASAALFMQVTTGSQPRDAVAGMSPRSVGRYLRFSGRAKPMNGDDQEMDAHCTVPRVDMQTDGGCESVQSCLFDNLEMLRHLRRHQLTVERHLFKPTIHIILCRGVNVHQRCLVSCIASHSANT